MANRGVIDRRAGRYHAQVQGQGPVQSRTNVIEWQKDPQIASQLAIARDRPLLVFVSAEWCGYCQKMKRETWSDATIIKQVRERFVPLYLDAVKHSNLISELGVEAFPTTLIVHPSGKITQELVGFGPSNQILPLLKKGAEAPSKSTAIARRTRL